jgi:hypothetical protein
MFNNHAMPVTGPACTQLLHIIHIHYQPPGHASYCTSSQPHPNNHKMPPAKHWLAAKDSPTKELSDVFDCNSSIGCSLATDTPSSVAAPADRFPTRIVSSARHQLVLACKQQLQQQRLAAPAPTVTKNAIQQPADQIISVACY